MGLLEVAVSGTRQTEGISYESIDLSFHDNLDIPGSTIRMGSTWEGRESQGGVVQRTYFCVGNAIDDDQRLLRGVRRVGPVVREEERPVRKVVGEASFERHPVFEQDGPVEIVVPPNEIKLRFE